MLSRTDVANGVFGDVDLGDEDLEDDDKLLMKLMMKLK